MVDKYLKPPFELIIVPKGSPQTKPRALNYAMGKAKGDIMGLPCIWTKKRHCPWDQRPYLLSTSLL